MARLGNYVNIRTGKLDANASSPDGVYPLFTCAVEPLRINTYSYDCECVLVAGNGDLNVKYYYGKFDAYQRTYIIESKDKNVLSVPYLFCFLEQYVEVLREQAIGGVIKYIKLGNLTEAEIRIPSIEEQNRIVAIIEKAKKLVLLRKQQIQLHDDLIKARFVEMFGENSSKTVPLKECCLDVRGGGTPSMQHPEYYGGNVPFIKSGDVRGDVVVSGALWLSDKALSETSAKYVPSGSVLVVNRSAALLKEFRAAIAGQPVVINQDIKAFVPKPQFTSQYLLWAIKIQTQYLLTKVTTVLTSHIDLKDLLDLRIVAASIERQNAFSAFVEQVDKSKSVIQKSLDETQLLFDSLMQQYFG